MTTPNLAKIERVDLREAWPNEARDFTPWLAANIAELGEALGMDLELQETEAAVGSYSLDLLATDINTNRPVIIENQLETTNHDHLGKLLTYAAGYDAGVVVWLTRNFRDEHRQTLDWLNQRTDKDTQFFGVAVELWRIGDSVLAPHFSVVATPNGWRKRAIANKKAITSLSTTESARTTGNAEKRRDFFQSLVDTLREEHSFTNTDKVGPKTSNWWKFPSGRSGITYRAFLGQKPAGAGVDVYIDGKSSNWNKQLLDKLERCKEKIEFELGTLDWQRLDNRKVCRITTTWPGIVDFDDVALEEIRDWMVKNLLKFKQVFDPKLGELVG